MLPPSPTLATEAKAELGEDALKQAKDAFEAADVNSSNDLDREEVEKVLLSMGISSASELAEIFLSSDRMDFDGFCIMIAPETARKCREKLGVAPQPPSPTKRKVPRQKLTGRFVTTDSVDFSQTFRSTRTGLPHGALSVTGRRANAGGRNPKGSRETHGRGVYTGPGTRREAAPPSTEKSPSVAESTPAGFAGFRQDGLDGRLKEVDEECAAEVDGLHSLSAELAKMTGSLDDLKSTMTTFWQTRHEVIDEKERKTYNAAVTIQKLFRRFSVRLRMARWVAEEATTTSPRSWKTCGSRSRSFVWRTTWILTGSRRSSPTSTSR